MIIKELKSIKDSKYYNFKCEFNYNLNKIEGHVFSIDDIMNLIMNEAVNGTYKKNELLLVKNSLELFDLIIDTLNDPVTKESILEYHNKLKKTPLDKDKAIQLENLILWWYGLKNISMLSIAEFNLKFQNIHLFKSHNLRLSLFIILKQCIESNIGIPIINENNFEQYKRILVRNNVGELYGFFSNCEKYECI